MLEEIKPRAFYKHELESFVAPPKLRKIGEMAFEDCSELSDLRLNEGLEVLKKYCFKKTGIQRLILPSSVGKIRSKAFYKCKYLQFADLRAAKDLKKLERGTFASCTSLRNVLLGAGLKVIGYGCFAHSGI